MTAELKNKYRELWKKKYPREAHLRAEASAKVVAFLSQTSEFHTAPHIALFAATPWEVDLTPLWYLRPGACVYPVSNPASRELTFYSIQSVSDLQPGYARLLEPPARKERRVAIWTEECLVLVPGFAFDRSGGRVGSGLGFYDRFLQGKPVQKWGICFKEQLIKERLAQEATDVRMGGLCTEEGWITCG